MSGKKPLECVDCKGTEHKVIITPYDKLPRCFPCRQKLALKILKGEIARAK